MIVDVKPLAHRAKKMLLYAMPMILVWTIYLLTFWPGILSPDSINQWGQAQSGQYSDTHPVLYTFSIWLLTRFWLSPAVVGMIQIILFACAVSWALYELNQFGVPTWVAFAFALVFAFSPVNGMMVITLWKDVPYSISILILTILFLKIIFSNGKWMDTRIHGVALGVVTAFIAGWRHNGVLVVIPCLLLLLVVYRAYWRDIALSLIVFFAGWLLVTEGLNTLLRVEKHPEFKNIILLHHIAAHVAAGTSLTTEETTYLNSLYPLPDWPYSCCSVDDTYFHAQFNRTVYNQDLFAPREIFLDLLARDPMVDLKHQICSSTMIWKIDAQCNFSTVWIYREGDRITWIEPNQYGIVEDSQIPGLVPILYRILEKIEENRLVFNVVWSVAFYLYLLLTVVAFMAIRMKSWKVLLLASPAVFQSATLALANLAQNFRYQYPVYLMGLLLVVLIFMPIKKLER